MKRVRLIMVGGFLGAGKTTTLARLARHYQKQGQRVGVVTNDQSQHLVDTLAFRQQGISVEEVAGACFCCRFDELTARIRQLEASARPDVILAEPVGSCTDLVATVLLPLADVFGPDLHTAPFVVLFKPRHGRKILQRAESGFSPKAAYIFEKQLEEADAIALNRVDEMSPSEVEELRGILRERFPGVPTLAISAKTGAGFSALTELLEFDGQVGRRVLDIDYDVYGQGEAEMGWVNASCQWESDLPLLLDQLLYETLTSIADQIRASRGEIGHLKALAIAEGSYAVGNLVSNDAGVELSLPCGVSAQSGELVVNARAILDPSLLRTIIEDGVGGVAARRGVRANWVKWHSLRPGFPVPTHRYNRPT